MFGQQKAIDMSNRCTIKNYFNVDSSDIKTVELINIFILSSPDVLSIVYLVSLIFLDSLLSGCQWICEGDSCVYSSVFLFFSCIMCSSVARVSMC